MSPIDFKAINEMTAEQAIPLLRLACATNTSTARSFAAHCRKFAAQYCEPGLTAAEQLFALLNPTCTRMCCQCGSKLTRFYGPSRGWGNYCSRACSTSADQRKQRFIETSMQKYGVPSPKQTARVNEKMAATNQARYGHVCNLHSSSRRHEIRQKIAAQLEVALEKIKATNRARYGVEWQTQRAAFISTCQSVHWDAARDRDEVRISAAKEQGFELLEKNQDRLHKWKHSCGWLFESPVVGLRCPGCSTRGSAVEQEIADFIAESTTFEIERHARIFGDRREVDIFIPALQLAIEVNGCWWHREEVDRGRMLQKTVDAKSRGIQLLHVWDVEWYQQQHHVQAAILSKLGQNSKIAARDTIVQAVSPADADAFCQEHHRQASARSRVRLGLYHNGALISLLTVGAPRFDRSVEWEIIRFVSAPGISVVGGFERLLKAFERGWNPSSIGTYADLAWGTGAIYRAAGFQFEKNTSPGYFWVNSKYQRLSRHRTQLRRLPQLLGAEFNSQLSEAENMTAAGWWRCRDLGHALFKKIYSQPSIK